MLELEKTVLVCGGEYTPKTLLGRGKGGYSYLAVDSRGNTVCLKQIHHEPCDYYQFGNKIAAEENDYARLCKAGIKIPKLIALDRKNERLVKEFIDGIVISDLIKAGRDISPYLPQARAMAEQARRAGLNIDYYPTNFVARRGELFYIDYECNAFMEEWSFDRWGIRQWLGEK